MRRLQAIDIGTNSVRSIIVEFDDGEEFRIIDDEKAMTRLGNGLSATGLLAEEPMRRTIDALRAMLAIGQNLKVERVRAIATAALRMAENGPAFKDRLNRELGVEVEVISEEEEGRLVFLSAANNFPFTGRNACVDIGGGSVEVVTAVDAEVERIVSMPLGARVLSERFVDGDPITECGFKRMKKYVRSMLRDRVGESVEGIRTLVGSGGTVTSTAALVAAASGDKFNTLHALELTRVQIMRLLSDLSRSSADERRRMPGMPADRVDIMLAGVLALAETMKLTGAGSVLVNARGMREGIVIDMLRQADAESGTPDRMQSVRRFGERCRYDQDHAEQVATLALDLFDQLAGPLGLDPSTRELLEASALVHDVGYCIAYDRHHRHTYHLVAHAALPGFTNREIRRIASTARYHTKALPKASHEAWASLDDRDRRAVEPLAAILRLADALDRGRAGHVRSLRATLEGSSLMLYIDGDGDLHPEVFGVEQKKDLFERAFGIPVIVRVAGRPNEV